MRLASVVPRRRGEPSFGEALNDRDFATRSRSTTFGLTLSVALERVTTDRIDKQSGLQVHALYVLPTDGTDEQLDQFGAIEESVRSWRSASLLGIPELQVATFADAVEHPARVRHLRRALRIDGFDDLHRGFIERMRVADPRFTL